MAARDKRKEQTGPFMILTAPSAKRKARLVQLFAEALGMRVRLTPVYEEGEWASGDPEGEMLQADWNRKDAMVGFVRTQEQLRFNLKKRGYYVPAQYMPEEHLDIRYIALREQDIGGKPGIRWIGQVLTVEKRPRGKIPVTMRPGTDPGEPYYFFTVQKWRQLPRQIIVQDSSRGRPRFTSRFLLEHCTRSWQLFAVTSREDYRLLRLLDRAYSELPDSGVYRLDENCRLLVADGYFTVVKDAGEVLDQIAVTNVSRSPYETFCRLRSLLYNKGLPSE